MNIIFLDLDGVICLPPQWNGRAKFEGESICEFDKESVKLLNELIERTKARIVLSSSWRVLFDLELLKRWFKHEGVIGEIIAKTPRIPGYQRGTEIQEWLDKYENIVDNFIILDDNTDMLHLKPRLIHTLMGPWENQIYGITRQNVEDAVKLMETK